MWACDVEWLEYSSYTAIPTSTGIVTALHTTTGSSATITSLATRSETYYWSGPTPTCSLNAKQCSSLISSYEEAADDYYASSSAGLTPSPWTLGAYPACTTSAAANATSTSGALWTVPPGGNGWEWMWACEGEWEAYSSMIPVPTSTGSNTATRTITEASTTIPVPTCTLNSAECSSLVSSFGAANQAYWSSSSASLSPIWTLAAEWPVCTNSATANATVTPGTTSSSQWTVRANGTGLAYYGSCNNEWYLYSSMATLGVSTTTIVATETLTKPSTTITTPNSSNSTLLYTGATPACKLENAECATLRSYYGSLTSSYFSAISASLNPTWTETLLPPVCTITPTATIGNAIAAPVPPAQNLTALCLATGSPWSVAANGTGLDSAWDRMWECEYEWEQYSNLVQTGCGTGTVTYSYDVTALSTTITHVSKTNGTITYSGPAPSCTVNGAECSTMWSYYNALASDFWSSKSEGLDPSWNGDFMQPSCTPPPSFNMSVSGSGLSSMYSCQGLWQQYSYDISSGYGSFYTTNTSVWATDFTATITTLCDGRERVMGTLTPLSSYYYPTQAMYRLNYTGPPPNCTINNDDCYSMSSNYQSAVSSYNMALSTDGSAKWPGSLSISPVCNVTGTLASALSTTRRASVGNASACGYCTIYGGSVQLLYFPVTTNYSRDMCATKPPASSSICPFGEVVEGGAATNAVGQAEGPCTYKPFNATSTLNSGPFVVSAGTTFYENRAYISYDTAYASDGCGRVGSDHAGGLLTVASTDLYSLVRNWSISCLRHH
ncbi:hypothetical protein BAUCODRAFT_502344 [Baudoinia panamericana UAMH 10762]|uniref:Uncharacterized protein n=1 Tax=Baudoinia panamericana (strain UAMH 10762) TaxID=717646 RepID=M2LN32_BAUPA|nr:uncharacterized protein BAUCODRAFT_502344 [Baudoinia panamericana UAMH 10762]EMC95752.1 hypothetical protein BAUCODRAFT_502344 [Baudoinia panamericana UAMH 10762]